MTNDTPNDAAPADAGAAPDQELNGGAPASPELEAAMAEFHEKQRETNEIAERIRSALRGAFNFQLGSGIQNGNAVEMGLYGFLADVLAIHPEPAVRARLCGRLMAEAMIFADVLIQAANQAAMEEQIKAMAGGIGMEMPGGPPNAAPGAPTLILPGQ